MIPEDLRHFAAIVCVDDYLAIGNNGKLLFDIKEDKEYFAGKTKGHTVIMGHNTYLDLPKKEPLSERFNVVMSRQGRIIPGFKVMHSVDEVVHSVNPRDSYVIGGEQIYRALLPYCSMIYMTMVHSDIVRHNMDAHFPVLTNEWEQLSSSWWRDGIDRATATPVKYKFIIWKRR